MILPANVQIAKVEEVSDVGKVSTNQTVDGVQWDGEEGNWWENISNWVEIFSNILTCKGQTELDILTGGGGDSQVLVGPRGCRVGLVKININNIIMEILIL